jgi:hypothetical protein
MEEKAGEIQFDTDKPRKNCIDSGSLSFRHFAVSDEICTIMPHCGHLVLLRLRDQDYPGTKNLDEWPTWNVPILKWAKAQGAVVGYAHSAGGLSVDSDDLPNYLIPGFDSSGANEYIVDVTHGLVDFISGCDLWPIAELNICYHTLSCGFRTVFAGETDFPCISDRYVGSGRSYVHLSSRPKGDTGYDEWISGLRNGHSYAGDGRSHVFDFAVNGTTPMNSKEREIHLDGSSKIMVTANVCARLEPNISDETLKIQRASKWDKPEWHLERARIGSSRTVAVELIVNGKPVARIPIVADGSIVPLSWDIEITQSSWVAVRIFPSCHTNAMFVIVRNAPIRASKKSARWCREAVDVCWAQKAPRTRQSELAEAANAYDHARVTYDKIIAESHID